MLILASSSETRNALLRRAGLAFEARSADVNERAIEAAALGDGLPVDGVARRLAETKALAVPGRVVIGADQLLVLDGRPLHKVATLARVRERLWLLRGRTHELVTAVALAVDGRIGWSHVATARLTLREFAEAELDAVLAAEGAALLGAAGGYRIEGPAITLFAAIEGDYFSILGLPLLSLLDALRHLGPGPAT